MGDFCLKEMQIILYSQLTTTKIKKMSKLNEEMMLLEKEQNKKDEPYRRVLSVSANAPKTRKGRAKHISLLRNAEKENENCSTISPTKQQNQRKNT